MSKLFRLNIKGSLSQCLVELEKRYLIPLGWHEYDCIKGCAIDVKATNEQLANWFNENDPERLYGYRIGSLLLYTSHEAYSTPPTKLSGII